jgi:non-specific serine/threonine protein kinase
MIEENNLVYDSIIRDFKRSLDYAFTSKIRARARVLAKTSQIQYNRISFEDGVIEASVQGSARRPYEIKLKFLGNQVNSYEINALECTCPFNSACKHQAALLFDLIKELKLKRKLKEKEAKKIFSKSKPHYSGEYFTIPRELSSLEILDAATIKSNQRDLPWGVETRFTFESSHVICIYTSKKMYSYQSNLPEMKIWIKYEDERFYYKCGSCNEKLKGFCAHQYMLIQDMFYVIMKDEFQTWNFNFDTQYEALAEKLSLSKELIKNHFRISYNKIGKLFYDTDQKILDKNSWDNMYKRIVQPDRKLNLSESEIIRAALIDAVATKGIIWDLGVNANLSLLNVVMGPPLKTKPGLNISKSYFLDGNDAYDNDLNAEFIDQINSLQNTQSDFEKLINLLNENLSWLKNKPQYVNLSYQSYYKLKKGDLQIVSFKNEQLIVEFEISLESDSYLLSRKLKLANKIIKASDILQIGRFLSYTKGRVFINPSINFADFHELFDKSDSIFLPKISAVELQKLVYELEKIGQVNIEDNLLPEQVYIDSPKLKIKLRESNEAIIFEPIIMHEGAEFDISNIIPVEIDDKIFIPRAEDVEFLYNYLRESHPNFEDIHRENFFFLTISDLLKNNWFLNFCEGCEAVGIDLLGIKELNSFKYSTKRASFSTNIKSGIDWFDVDMKLSFGKERIATKDWIRAIKNGENFVSLKDGSLGLLPEEWLNRAKEIMSVAEFDKEDIKISHYKFNVVDALFDDLKNPDIIEFIQDKKERLEKCKLDRTYKVPKKIEATLRGYQHHGYNWLRFLNESGFGGILADDMGLGKTIQVITMLASLKKNSCSLVIVPKSLLFNWCNELDKFCPTLSYLLHHGPKRAKMLEQITPYNIVLSTYDTAASDIAILRFHIFDYIVLDESQAIKNIQSKRYKAMCLLQSENKLAMTGTPIENNTFDLYAQLSFASPGLLNSSTEFKRNFSDPIDNNGNAEAASLLKKIVHPFILRRTKEQVAKDLPSKTVTTIYCEMEPTQRKLYDILKEQIKEDVYSAIEEDGLNKSRFKILEGLLRLRQMCNSPLLVNPNFKGKNTSSVKIDLLVNNLKDTLQKHNALVFSQFTSLLAIIRKELDRNKIKYAYLDGKTKDREAEVKKFMENDDIKLFLISIKAGNTGLNLTKADYVYIVDPWWNPAVEAQAIDRTHRIGQKKNIFAYKLICKDTIEEKILKLQDKKKGIADDIIQTDEKVFKKLKKEDLMDLLQ